MLLLLVVMVSVVETLVMLADGVVVEEEEVTLGEAGFIKIFLMFWKGASNRTVKATEAKNMQIYSLVSS